MALRTALRRVHVQVALKLLGCHVDLVSSLVIGISGVIIRLIGIQVYLSSFPDPPSIQPRMKEEKAKVLTSRAGMQVNGSGSCVVPANATTDKSFPTDRSFPNELLSILALLSDP